MSWITKTHRCAHTHKHTHKHIQWFAGLLWVLLDYELKYAHTETVLLQVSNVRCNTPPPPSSSKSRWIVPLSLQVWVRVMQAVHHTSAFSCSLAVSTGSSWGQKTNNGILVSFILYINSYSSKTQSKPALCVCVCVCVCVCPPPPQQ